MTRGDGVVQSRRDDHLAASTYLERGWMRLALGDFDGARAALEQVRAFVPHHDEARILLAWVLAEQSNTFGAEALMNEAPCNPALHGLVAVVRALAQVRRGCAEAALVELAGVTEPASSQAPSKAVNGDPRVRLYAPLVAGLAHAALGHHAEAMAAYAQCLARGPNCAQAWEAQGAEAHRVGDLHAARESWSAGAQTARFSSWGRRCAERLAAIDTADDPPAVRS